MTPFRERLRSLDLTAAEFARIVGVHAKTVLGWGLERHSREVQEVPRWAWLLLDAWERIGVPRE